jgi:hypothetical protein
MCKPVETLWINQVCKGRTSAAVIEVNPGSMTRPQMLQWFRVGLPIGVIFYESWEAHNATCI